MVEDFRSHGPGDEPPSCVASDLILPGYFETMGNRVLAGRAIDWADIHDRNQVVDGHRKPGAASTGDSPAAAIGKRVRATSRQIRGGRSSGWSATCGRRVSTDPPTPVVFWPHGHRGPRRRRDLGATDHVVRCPQPPGRHAGAHGRRQSGSVVGQSQPAGGRPCRPSRRFCAARWLVPRSRLVMLGIAAAASLLLVWSGSTPLLRTRCPGEYRSSGFAIALGANERTWSDWSSEQGDVVSGSASWRAGGRRRPHPADGRAALRCESAGSHHLCHGHGGGGRRRAGWRASCQRVRAATVDPAAALRTE